MFVQPKSCSNNHNQWSLKPSDNDYFCTMCHTPGVPTSPEIVSHLSSLTWWVDSQGLWNHHIQVRQPIHCLVGRHFAFIIPHAVNLLLQFFLNVRVSSKEISNKPQCVATGFIASNQEYNTLSQYLRIRQSLWFWEAFILSCHKHEIQEVLIEWIKI